MKTRNNLKNDVITEFQDWLSTEWENISHEDQINHLKEVIHSSIPVYTHELTEVALSNLDLVIMSPSFTMKDWNPAEILIININILLQEEIGTWFFWKR